MFFPLFKPTPDIVRLDAEHGTDIDKGEGPLGIVLSHPLFGFTGEALRALSVFDKLQMKIADRGIEHDIHQSDLATGTMRAKGRVVQLLR
jgi:hypothetical protein